MPPIAKGTKITDPIVLERLAKAREKALETRRANAQAKKDAKLVEQLEKKNAQKAVQDRLAAALPSTPKEEPKPPEPKPKGTPDKPEPPPVVEEDVVVEYMKAPKKPKKPKKRVVIVESSSASSESEPEPEVVYKKRARPPTRAPVPAQRRQMTEAEKKELYIDQLYQRYYGNR